METTRVAVKWSEVGVVFPRLSKCPPGQRLFILVKVHIQAGSSNRRPHASFAWAAVIGHIGDSTFWASTADRSLA
jgi:hypothetical protein